MQGLGPQQQSRRVEFLDSGQVFEGLFPLLLFRGNAGQLQVGISMDRIDLEQPFEISLCFSCLATDKIMIPSVVEDGLRRGTLRQGRLIVPFRLRTLSFGIQSRSLAQRLGLKIDGKSKHCPQKQDSLAGFLEHTHYIRSFRL